MLERDSELRAFLESGLVMDSAVLAQYTSLSESLSRYTGLLTEFSDEWRRSTVINTEVAATSESLLNSFDQLDITTADLASASVEAAHDGTAEVEALVGGSILRSLAILCASILIGAFFAVCITRGIVAPINAVILSLSQGTEVIEEATTRMGVASRDLSEGVSSQAGSLEETASALEEVSSMIRTSADNAKTTDIDAQKTCEMVQAGAADMREMSEAMSKINHQADRISNIIKTIEEIAFQTNLLALNAAVEAARAGEAGKGFAVVADEVRNLAGRSAAAAKDTAELITGTVESVHSGSEILSRLSGSYDEIAHGISEIQDIIAQIANATSEQSQGVEQINNAVAQMNRVTQQNATGAEESAASVKNLEGQLTDLHGSVQTLKGIVSGAKTQGIKERVAAIGTKILPPSLRLTGPMPMAGA
jgi:methyl-accepting chemotaxis protein